MDVQLDDFEDGRPIVFKTSQETGEKIKALKSKKNYKEMLTLAEGMPNTKEKYILLANVHLHLKNWKELSKTCERALDLVEEQDAGDFYNLRGKALGKLGDFEEKAVLTKRAIQINPKIPAYHRNLGAAFYKLKQYDKALVQHEKAINLEPKHSINYHNKGAAFFRLDQYSAAAESFVKAIELNRSQAISYGWLGDALREMGRFQEAKDNYLKAYELSDQDNYKEQATAMDAKINPDQKKGFFARIFG